MKRKYFLIDTKGAGDARDELPDCSSSKCGSIAGQGFGSDGRCRVGE